MPDSAAPFERRSAVFERKTGVDEPFDRDVAGRERFERRCERATARPDQGQLVHDGETEIERRRALGRGLQHDRATRLHQLEDTGQHVGVTGRFDREIERRSAFAVGLEQALRERHVVGQQLRALGVTANHGHVDAVVVEHVCAEQAEAAVAGDQAPRARAQRYLFGNLEGRGQRFGERRGVGRHRVGDRMQVRVGQDDLVGEGTGVVEDAEHRPPRAVAAQALLARRALAARRVDLTDDPTAAMRAVQSCADELVAGHAAKAHVAALQSEVGRADAGAHYPHASRAGLGDGRRRSLRKWT